VKVELSDEAKQQARKISAWWRANRDAKGLFKEELAAAKKVLRRDAGKLAVYSNEAGQAVRRFLLKRTGYHLYYVIDEERGVVRVAAIWGAARGSGPPL
jgi:plasmid stabilization system protein ParE